MKWGVVILLILGVIAAACAALLVGMMGAGSPAAASPGVEVVVARKSLPAMTVVTVEDFIKQMVSRNELPKGQVASPTRVVGRVLAVPVVEGQVLTEKCFIADGTGAQLAAALPEGMRAFTVNLSSRAVPERLLLYPGCVVDVLVSFKLSSQDRSGQALSTFMLQSIQVLAIQGDSVVSNPESQDGLAARTRAAGGSSGTLQVTLLVDQEQAKALQLAVEHGTIALVVRNPLDRSLGGTDATVLNQGRLATSGSALSPESLTAPQKGKQRELEKSWLESQIIASADPNAAPQTAPAAAGPAQQYEPPKRSRWGVTVIRGRESKTEEFESSTGEPNEPSEEK